MKFKLSRRQYIKGILFAAMLTFWVHQLVGIIKYDHGVAYAGFAVFTLWFFGFIGVVIYLHGDKD